MGHVRDDPRPSGHVRPNPQTTAAGPWGLWATTPIYRGTCGTTPKWPHRPTVPTGGGAHQGSLAHRKHQLRPPPGRATPETRDQGG
jgi:hypothetical protein